ncbi:unnamed protein product [Amoebophrya sp. A120]|nr:unnamed protein product [Amoebophrya sp. A120]|eukprot:GSA120T00005907001.1
MSEAMTRLLVTHVLRLIVAVLLYAAVFWKFQKAWGPYVQFYRDLKHTAADADLTVEQLRDELEQERRKRVKAEQDFAGLQRESADTFVASLSLLPDQYATTTTSSRSSRGQHAFFPARSSATSGVPPEKHSLQVVLQLSPVLVQAAAGDRGAVCAAEKNRSSAQKQGETKADQQPSCSGASTTTTSYPSTSSGVRENESLLLQQKEALLLEQASHWSSCGGSSATTVETYHISSPSVLPLAGIWLLCAEDRGGARKIADHLQKLDISDDGKFLTDGTGYMQRVQVISDTSLIWEDRELWLDAANANFLYRQSASRAAPLKYCRFFKKQGIR